MPSGSEVTVVVPVRDARDDLVRCLDSLRGQTLPDLEVLVVDDGSSDGSPDAAAAGGARVIRQERLGASRARNLGVSEARGGYVCFLDADCVAEPTWAEELCRPLRDDPSIAGTIGRYETDQTSLVARFVQLEHAFRYERMTHRSRIDFLNSGCCAFRRDLLVRYPFDPKYQRLEDVELSFRLTRDGHVMVYAPGAVAKHRHPESVRALVKRKFNYARYAPTLYRQYPAKAASDTSTPQSRRARLVFLGLFLLLLPFAWAHPAVLTAALLAGLASVAMSGKTLWRAFRASPQLGFASLGCIFLGNLAFLAGTARGFLAGKAPEAN